MTFLVGKVFTAGPARRGELQIQPLRMDRLDIIKNYYTSQESAVTAAEEKAVANPGEQYAVFGMIAIREAQKPAAPKLIKKVINESGEIVLET